MSGIFDLKAVEHFKEYLKIPSVHPDCNYSGCVSFLRKMAAGLGDKGLPLLVHEVAPGKPLVVITWTGSKPELSSILLSSHMDVVPVFPEHWIYKPFSAEEDKDGNIYARGAQDMKCVGIQYLEAVGRLMLQNFQPKRTIHICFTPDEEIGCEGMRLFVETDAFKKLNVGCGLDEGAPREDESFWLFYGERTKSAVTIVCEGTPGHGSLLHDNTAGEKITKVINKFMQKRDEEKRKLEEDPPQFMGDVTTINLTKIEGGVQTNVVPPELRVTFDIRVSLDTDLDEFDSWIQDVCREAGDGVRAEKLEKAKRIEPTKIDESNIWWKTLKTKFTEMDLKVNPKIFPAGTDAQRLRSKGISAFNFSPMNFTPVRAHAHNEFLNRKVFLKGIDIYCKLISALASVEES